MPKDIIWHFIGPIQSNKISLIAKHASWVHSIDREKVAKKLNDALQVEGKKIHALIQVNIDQKNLSQAFSQNKQLILQQSNCSLSKLNTRRFNVYA